MEKINRTLLIAVIALSAVVLVGIGLGLGVLIGKGGSQKAAEPETEVKEEVEVKETVEEKTYGFYPSFYVKKNYYWVNCDDAMHSIRIYTDGSVKVVESWTDTRWLEEEEIGEGGNQFHVKKNKDSASRKGILTIKDSKGRKINIYVTQGGEK